VPISFKEVFWWSLLPLADQLQLALLLAQKCHPVWAKFKSQSQAFYKNSLAGPSIQINQNLQSKALQEAYRPHHGTGISNQELEKCYAEFVGPVLALQEGNWLTNYLVKKTFLAVYHILKALLEKENSAGTKDLLTTSVNESLDCLDMAKLYSRQEVELFPEDFKNRIPKTNLSLLSTSRR